METADLIAQFQESHSQTLNTLNEVKKFADSSVKQHSEIHSRLSLLEQKVSRGVTALASSAQIGLEGYPDGPNLGMSITGHEAFKSWAQNGYEGKRRFKLEQKTVSTLTSATSGSGAAGSMIAPDVRVNPVAMARRRMTIRGLIAPGETSSNAVGMPVQTGRTLNAAPVAETNAKPQSGMDLTFVDFPVRTIAHWVQTSRQIMDDAPALNSFINAELEYGLQLTEENQMLTGDGTGENLQGLIPQATAYAGAFSITGETNIDRIAMALLQSELSLFPADGVVIHPTDWTKMRLTKDGQGQYILGNPAAAIPPVLWGVPLVVTPAIAAGSFLVGAFQAVAQVFDRMGMEILVSTEHGTNFTTNQITIRAEERLALAVKRPTALITGSYPQ